MSRGKRSKNPAVVDRIADCIFEHLEDVGIQDANIWWEPLPPTRLYRIGVVSQAFAILFHNEQQSLVWDALETNLLPPDLSRISMVLTLTPEENEDF